MKKNLKNLSALLLALILLLSLCVGCGDTSKPADEETPAVSDTQEETPAEDAAEDVFEDAAAEKTITLTVTYADETSQEYTIETEAEFLKEAIEATVEIEGSEGEYGYTLTSVNGVEADFTDGSNAYWAIYVNDEYGMYALDAQPVTDGDSYALVYETY